MKPTVCQVPGSAAGEQLPSQGGPGVRGDFSETSETLSLESARELAGRCLSTIVCLYCEVCQFMCPDQCITRDRDSGHILIDLDHCKGCGLCAHFCPKGAIQMVVEKQD